MLLHALDTISTFVDTVVVWAKNSKLRGRRKSEDNFDFESTDS